MIRIGIVGGGQLGKMLTEAAQKMSLSVTVVDPTPNCPAAQAGATQIVASLTDKHALIKLAEASDYVTFEIEHIDVDALIDLVNQGSAVNPHPETLHTIKDKLRQKRSLQTLGIPVAEFEQIENPSDVTRVAQKWGFPLVLKNRFGGYDGRGNALVRDETEMKKGFEKLGGKNLYVERFIPFVKELAIMVARNKKGDIALYPVVETIQKNNICHMTLAPAPIDELSFKKAQQLASETMQHLQGAGVFGIEMFLLEDGNVLINEIAPRVHNSGHYTIEACITSQFTQHLLAITGQNLGPTDMTASAAVMINILGDRSGDSAPRGVENAEQIPGVHVHLYEKSEVRPERKMGHITVTADSLEVAEENAIKARGLISL